MREITNGLKFPEGPIAMLDGSIILVEIARGTVSRVDETGAISVIAETGGGPNGAALGPDGALYICNNGGFEWHNVGGKLFAGDMPTDYSGGRIERVDIETGKIDILYTHCDGSPLIGPNDIVFDREGGMWFTDHGKGEGRLRHRGGLFYATIDGNHISQQVFPIESPNGVGLSPDERMVYVADSNSARLWGFEIESAGQVEGNGSLSAKNFIASPAGFNFFDSLAVEADGTVAVATIAHSGITRIHPETGEIRHVATDDPMTTNICFGGEDLRTAYITLSATGRLVATEWECAGTPLNFLNR